MYRVNSDLMGLLLFGTFARRSTRQWAFTLSRPDAPQLDDRNLQIDVNKTQVHKVIDHKGNTCGCGRALVECGQLQQLPSSPIDNGNFSKTTRVASNNRHAGIRRVVTAQQKPSATSTEAHEFFHDLQLVTSGALPGGGEAAEFAVLHHGAAHPVDLGVARDRLVVRVDHDHLEVLVCRVLKQFGYYLRRSPDKRLVQSVSEIATLCHVRLRFRATDKCPYLTLDATV